ncbi:MAG TPA: hypothetical protein VIL15_03730 [Coriobacteriia bacterium]
MPRLLFGLLLLVHGAIHLAWLQPAPDDPKWPFLWRSPWLPKVGEEALRNFGTAAIALMCVGYVIAALGVWGVGFLAGMWVPAALLASALSFVVIAVLWHPWFFAGPTVDVVIAAAALLHWVA